MIGNDLLRVSRKIRRQEAAWRAAERDGWERRGGPGPFCLGKRSFNGLFGRGFKRDFNGPFARGLVVLP